MLSIVIAVFALTTALIAGMPTTMTTSTQKVALLSAEPCFFTSIDSMTNAGAVHDGTDSDATTKGASETDIQASLSKLQFVSSELKHDLTSLLNDTVATEWALTDESKNVLSAHFHYRWTLNGMSGMDNQEIERLKALIRFSGYIIFIEDGLKLSSASEIFVHSTSALKQIEEKLVMAACQVRELLPNMTNGTIYKKALDSVMPIGQRYMESVDSSVKSVPHLLIRYLVALALEDMLNTFSHLEVTAESGVLLDGSK